MTVKLQYYNVFFVHTTMILNKNKSMEFMNNYGNTMQICNTI